VGTGVQAPFMADVGSYGTILVATTGLRHAFGSKGDIVPNRSHVLR
jgi:hypothetical protein